MRDNSKECKFWEIRANDTKARTSYWTLVSVTSSGDFQDVALQVEQLESVSIHDCPFRQRWSKVICAPNKFETSEVDQADGTTQYSRGRTKVMFLVSVCFGTSAMAPGTYEKCSFVFVFACYRWWSTLSLKWLLDLKRSMCVIEL